MELYNQPIELIIVSSYFWTTPLRVGSHRALHATAESCGVQKTLQREGGVRLLPRLETKSALAMRGLRRRDFRRFMGLRIFNASRIPAYYRCPPGVDFAPSWGEPPGHRQRETLQGFWICARLESADGVERRTRGDNRKTPAASGARRATNAIQRSHWE